MSIPRQKQFYGELNGKHSSIARCHRKGVAFWHERRFDRCRSVKNGKQGLVFVFLPYSSPSEKEVCRPLPRNERSSLSLPSRHRLTGHLCFPLPPSPPSLSLRAKNGWAWSRTMKSNLPSPLPPLPSLFPPRLLIFWWTKVDSTSKFFVRKNYSATNSVPFPVQRSNVV